MMSDLKLTGKGWEWRKRGIPFATALLLSGLIILYYIRYIQIAGFRIPIMDYYRWMAWYAQRVYDGEMSLWDFFSDTNEQIQPLGQLLTFGVLKIGNFSFWPLVVIGTVLRCALALALGALLLRQNAKSDIFYVIGTVCVVACVLSPNQWEMVIEPFAMMNAVRMIVFLLSFVWVGYMLHHFFEASPRHRLLEILLLSLVGAAVALLLAGAYFVAYLGAISLAFVMALLLNRHKLNWSYLIPAAIWALAVIGSLVGYMSLASVSGSAGGRLDLGKVIRGFFIYLGGSIIPNQYSENVSSSLAFYVGIALLAVSCALFFLYTRRKKEKINYLPLMMQHYALINGLVIAYGRASAYGPGSLASSRYTVESLMFVMGLIWVICDTAAEHRKLIIKIGCGVVMAGLIAGLASCYETEWRMAPYRRAYQDQMRRIAEKIDEHEDGDLTVFQESPENVRETIRFYHDNGLEF